jgi:hypothetical protein
VNSIEKPSGKKTDQNLNYCNSFFMIEYDCQHSETINEDHCWTRRTTVVVIHKVNA